MEAVEFDPGHEFQCPNCGEVSVHRAKAGSRISIWCPSCKEVTEYRVRADGGIHVIEEG